MFNRKAHFKQPFSIAMFKSPEGNRFNLDMNGGYDCVRYGYDGRLINDRDLKAKKTWGYMWGILGTLGSIWNNMPYSLVKTQIQPVKSGLTEAI